MKILSAQFVLPINDELIKNGAVVIEKDKIISVGSRETIAKNFPDVRVEDFGCAVIMPGLINCHSHLELTAMRGFLDEFDDDFFSWLIKLTKTRADKLKDEDIELAALLGALEAVRAGITCLGDIGRWGNAGLKAMKKNGLRGVLFQETEFSPDNQTAKDDFQKLKEKFLRLREKENELVKVGLSPHAPYTVSQVLFEKIADFSIQENFPITIHAAESDKEQELMVRGQGFFAKLYREQGINWSSPNCSTIGYLNNIGVLEARPLLAHCVRVSSKDISIMAEKKVKIAHCPKSNAKFGHGIAPFSDFLKNEIPVGFGSDSMASNNTCDIFEEARFATLLSRVKPDEIGPFINARQIIKTATFGGAQSLGLDKNIGSLEPGKQADLIVISLEEVSQQPIHDIYTTLLFATGARNVQMTMVAGEEIFRDGKAKRVDGKELVNKIKKMAEKM